MSWTTVINPNLSKTELDNHSSNIGLSKKAYAIIGATIIAGSAAGFFIAKKKKGSEIGGAMLGSVVGLIVGSAIGVYVDKNSVSSKKSK